MENYLEVVEIIARFDISNKLTIEEYDKLVRAKCSIIKELDDIKTAYVNRAKTNAKLLHMMSFLNETAILPYKLRTCVKQADILMRNLNMILQYIDVLLPIYKESLESDKISEIR